jgi:acetyltransferase-like isoleucine patch superfamily enzyme
MCESDEVGARTRIWAFAQVMQGARVGSDCNICGHSFVEGGAVLGDRVTVKNGVQVWDKVTVEDEVFLGPNSTFTNDFNPRAAFSKAPDEFLPTLIKRGSTIGANATVVCGVVIGAHAFIGAGSVVIRDVPAHALVVGNPARRTGWVCACGDKLGDDLACHCGRRYRLVDEKTGLAPIE